MCMMSCTKSNRIYWCLIMKYDLKVLKENSIVQSMHLVTTKFELVFLIPKRKTTKEKKRKTQATIDNISDNSIKTSPRLLQWFIIAWIRLWWKDERKKEKHSNSTAIQQRKKFWCVSFCVLWFWCYSSCKRSVLLSLHCLFGFLWIVKLGNFFVCKEEGYCVVMFTVVMVVAIFKVS